VARVPTKDGASVLRRRWDMDDKPPIKMATQKPKSSQKSMPQKPTSNPMIHDMIAVRLRNYYSQMAEEPIPERFTELLKQLDAQSAKTKKKE
jgi:Anti-sigma factor NepR